MEGVGRERKYNQTCEKGRCRKISMIREGGGRTIQKCYGYEKRRRRRRKEWGGEREGLKNVKVMRMCLEDQRIESSSQTQMFYSLYVCNLKA